jgi:uncharacterized caspase-like protein
MLVAGPAAAERRVALVIGNSVYGHQASLPNVSNDAAAIAALLRAARFDSVEAKANLGVVELRRALRDLAVRTAGADVAVLYFAGHGIEVDRTNYLIPVDAKLAADIDVEDETVALDRVLQLMEPAKRLRLVILDACRENPFAGRMKATTATRAIGRGLGRVEPAISNTLIAYATKANAVAEDGKGANSPFTAALLKHLTAPGLDLRIALGHVRDDVLASTGNKQEPYFTGSLGGGTLSLASPVPPPSKQQASPAGEIARICREVEAMSNPATLAVLERHHRGTPAGECVAARLKQLATVTPPVSAPPPVAVKQPDMAPKSGSEEPKALPKADKDGTNTKVKPPSRSTTTQRPNALAYSKQIWPGHSVPTDTTVSADTPYGRLVCIGGNFKTGQPRVCRWR